MAYSTYMNPVYDSGDEGAVTPDLEDGRKRWPWLGIAPLSGLLTAMAYVMGLKSVLESIRAHGWLQKAVTDDVWLCLGRLCAGRMDLALPHDVNYLKGSVF